jgi:hypothetical protein
MVIVVANLHADHKEISAMGQVKKKCLTENNTLGPKFFVDTYLRN